MGSRSLVTGQGNTDTAETLVAAENRAHTSGMQASNLRNPVAQRIRRGSATWCSACSSWVKVPCMNTTTHRFVQCNVHKCVPAGPPHWWHAPQSIVKSVCRACCNEQRPQGDPCCSAHVHLGAYNPRGPPSLRKDCCNWNLTNLTNDRQFTRVLVYVACTSHPPSALEVMY
jgi:hypothetical protein